MLPLSYNLLATVLDVSPTPIVTISCPTGIDTGTTNHLYSVKETKAKRITANSLRVYLNQNQEAQEDEVKSTAPN